MPMSDTERQQLNAQLAQIYDWGGQVDEWGAGIQEHVGFIDAQLEAQRDINADNAEWRHGVDQWGEEADRRFLQLGRRNQDLQEAYIGLRRQVIAMRQLTHTIPAWPLVLGAIAGVVTGFIVGMTVDDRSNWWATGVGIAVGAIVFGVLFFLNNIRDTHTVATSQPPVQQQQPRQAQPAGNQPTRTMPATQQNPPTPQPATATPNP